MRPTGVAIVDHVLGGYPPGLPLVVAGASGTGRTVLGLQLAHQALGRGEQVLFVSSEPAPSLIQQAGALDLALESAVREERLVLLELDASAPALVRAQGVEALARALRAEAPDASLMVVDPFTAITAEVVDEPRLREVARGFVRAIPLRHVVLTAESERLATQRGYDRVLSELCGAYLLLEREPSGRRMLGVEKTRTGVGASENVEFAIGPGGTHLVGDAEPLVREAAAEADVSDAAWVGPSATAAPEPPPRRARRAPAPPPAAPSAAAAAPPEAPEPGPEPAGDEASEAPADPARPSVLVVEDSRLQRELISDWLADRYEVITAADGFEAMSTLLSRRPDLVILDLIMPRITGYELLCAMRRAGLDVPVLVSSSRVQKAGDRIAPLVLGATDFLAKPVSRLELEHKVETLLRLERSPARRFDHAEAEALFGRIAMTRLLDADAFRERLDRAHRFGERHGLPSSLLRVTAAEPAELDAWIEAADPDLRFEDAILRQGKTRAWVLLVATPTSDAKEVIARLGARAAEARDASGRAAEASGRRADEAGGYGGAVEITVHEAAPEALDAASEPPAGPAPAAAPAAPRRRRRRRRPAADAGD